jgi:hypothetical protein
MAGEELRIRISLFTLMQVRILIFYFNADPDRNLPLVKLMRSCDHWSTDRLRIHIDPPWPILSLHDPYRASMAHFEPPRFYCERPCIQFVPLKLWIQIQLIRIRIQTSKIMRIHEDPDSQVGQCNVALPYEHSAYFLMVHIIFFRSLFLLQY